MSDQADQDRKKRIDDRANARDREFRSRKAGVVSDANEVKDPMREARRIWQQMRKEADDSPSRAFDYSPIHHALVRKDKLIAELKAERHAISALIPRSPDHTLLEDVEATNTHAQTLRAEVTEFKNFANILEAERNSLRELVKADPDKRQAAALQDMMRRANREAMRLCEENGWRTDWPLDLDTGDVMEKRIGRNIDTKRNLQAEVERLKAVVDIARGTPGESLYVLEERLKDALSALDAGETPDV